MTKSFLVRASVSEQEVTAGLKNMMSNIIKKGVMTFVGMGLFSSLALGKPIHLNSSKAATLEKEHNAVFVEAESDTRLKVNVKDHAIEYRYVDQAGENGYSIQVVSKGKDSAIVRMVKVGEGGDELGSFAAKQMYEMMKKEILDEGITIKK